MNKSRLKSVIKLSNYYYKLARIKYAGEDILEEQYISRYHPEYAPEEEEPSGVLISDKSRPARVSSLGNETLPSYEEFEKHYANTNFNYRLIYLSDYFDLRKTADAVPIDKYKNMISDRIAKIEDKIANSYDYRGADFDNLLKEGKYLLNNFDSIFGKNSINILVNKLDKTDSPTPEAIDHDIGHRIFDTNNYFDYIKSIMGDNYYRKFKEAFLKDYIIIDTETNKEANYISNDLFDVFNLQKMFHLILTKDKLPKGISAMNIAKSDLRDLLQDLLPIYNKNAETFKGLQFKGITFYSNIKGDIGLNPEYQIYGSLKKYKYMIKPKDENTPNINEYITKYLELMEIYIKKCLSDLVGKVFTLW